VPVKGYLAARLNCKKIEQPVSIRVGKRPRRLPSLKELTSLAVLGQRIRKARKKKGLSQEDLAFEAELDRSYVGGVERGQRNPSFKILCAIAIAVGRDVGSLTRDLPLGSEKNR